MANLFIHDPSLLFRKYGIIAVYLFGSHTKDAASGTSDYDIAVFKDTGTNFDKITFLKDLTDIFKYPEKLDVSFVDLQNSAPLLLFQIIKNGQLLYERKPKEYVGLESLIMRMYYHDQHRLNIYYQALKQRYVNR